VDKERVSDVLLLTVAAIWGMNYIAMKFLLAVISPVNMILFRFLAGSMFLFLLLLFLEDVKISVKDFLYLSLVGVLGVGLFQFTFTYALKYTAAINVSIIMNTSPLFGAVLSVLFRIETFVAKRLLGMIIGFIGVYIIITKGTLYLQGGDTLGNLLAVSSSLLWALSTILSKPLLTRHSPLKVAAYSTITGSIVLCFFVPSHFSTRELAELSVFEWTILLYTVVFSMIVAILIWFRGVSRIGPSRAMLYQYSVPVFAVFFALLLLKEQLYLSQVIGAAIVFCGIMLARKG
jgi:drug/metabolite transporter (DMT)-like permease